jgi:cellulase/cellobiase CelA1
VRYEIVNAWPDGFQATVTVTSPAALHDWRVGWTFDGDQRVTQVWDAALTQSGRRVTATAADYNKNVTAGGTFALGFLGSGSAAGPAPHDFTLNGGRCRGVG